MQTYGGKKSIKPCHAARKKRLQTLLFFATSFISISFLKPHLASWSSTSLQDPSENPEEAGLGTT